MVDPVLAADGDGDDEPPAPLSLVVVKVGAAWLAFAADDVEEIVAPGAIARLPRSPAHIVGLTLVGSRAIPVVDLGGLLAIAGAGEVSEVDRLVVVVAGELRAAIRCARVKLITDVPRDSIREPKIATGALATYTLGELELDATIAQRLDVAALLQAARATGR